MNFDAFRLPRLTSSDTELVSKKSNTGKCSHQHRIKAVKSDSWIECIPTHLDTKRKKEAISNIEPPSRFEKEPEHYLFDANKHYENLISEELKVGLHGGFWLVSRLGPVCDEPSTFNEKQNLPPILRFNKKKSINDKIFQSFHSEECILSDDSSEGESCQFCKQSIKELCCPEREYFEQLREEYKEIAKKETQEITKKPSKTFEIARFKNQAPKGKVTFAEQRKQEKDVEKQKTRLYSVARQLKTIQYTISSMRALEKGWTVRQQKRLASAYQMQEEPFLISDNSSYLQKCKALNERFYNSGSLFMRILPDGNGFCYFKSKQEERKITLVSPLLHSSCYPNGRIAVMTVSAEKGKYTYIIFKNQKYNSVQSKILAVFKSNGIGFCFYKTNKVRMFLNLQGGIELDRQGNKRKRWQWHFVKGHVLAPPFQPMCFSLNKWISLRVMNLHHITLSFSSKRRFLRCNVAANIEAQRVVFQGKFPADRSSEFHLAGQRIRINSILKKINVILASSTLLLERQ